MQKDLVKMQASKEEWRIRALDQRNGSSAKVQGAPVRFQSNMK